MLPGDRSSGPRRGRSSRVPHTFASVANVWGVSTIGDGARSALQVVPLRFSPRDIILPALHGEIGTHCPLIRKVRE